VFLTPINLIWLACVLAVITVFAGWPRAGGILFLGVILFAPVGVFGTAHVRVELVLVPLILALQILNGTLRWPAALIPAVGWLSLVVAVSLLTEGDVHPIGLYGLSRFAAVCLIFSSIPYREHEVLAAQKLFVLSAIPMALLSLGQLFAVPFARWLTEFAYYTPEQAVFDLQIESENQGCIFRAQAVFGNNSTTGTYFVTVIGVAVVLLAECWRKQGDRDRTALTAGLIAALAGGAATLTATFIAGLFPVLVGAVAFSPASRRKAAMAIVAVLAVVTIAVAWVTIRRSETLGAQIEYQWDRILAGQATEGRYSYREGVLAEAYEEIRENLFFGRGAKVTTTFAGDSLYVMVLYTSGIVGSLLLVTALATMARRAWLAGLPGRLALVWTLAVLMCGVGACGMFILRFGDWWWATQGMLLGLVGSTRQVNPMLGPCTVRRDRGEFAGHQHRRRHWQEQLPATAGPVAARDRRPSRKGTAA
jgi:hypothetical protein